MEPSQDLRTIELRPDLLNHQFKVDTKWCVVTGAPSAGKTTVLKHLEAKGFSWMPEIARIYVEDRLAAGQTLDQIRGDEAKFQRGLIDTKLRVEQECYPDSVAFFDRAMPDSITYYRAAGLDPNDVLADCFNFRYGSVLLFDRLPLEADHVRTEDEATSNFIDHWLELDYQALGYDVIRVPVMSVENRVEFVLDRLKTLDLV